MKKFILQDDYFEKTKHEKSYILCLSTHLHFPICECFEVVIFSVSLFSLHLIFIGNH